MPLRTLMVVAITLILLAGCHRKGTGPKAVQEELKDLQDARKREWSPDQ